MGTGGARGAAMEREPSGYIRVPNPDTYKQLPYVERRRLYFALKLLTAEWALAELDMNPMVQRSKADE